MNYQAMTYFIAKFAGIVLMLNVVPNLASFGALFLFSAEKVTWLSSADQWQILTSYALQLVAGLVLLFASGRVVDWLSVSAIAPDGVFDTTTFEKTCVGLIGIYFFVTGASLVLFEIVRVHGSSRFMSGEAMAPLACALGILAMGFVIMIRRSTIVEVLARYDSRFRKN